MALTEHQLAAIKADGVTSGRFEADLIGEHPVTVTYYPDDSPPEYVLLDLRSNIQVFNRIEDVTQFIKAMTEPTSLERAVELSRSAAHAHARAANLVQERNFQIGKALEEGATADEVASATGLSVPAIRKIVQQLRNEGAIGYLDNRKRNKTQSEVSINED